MVGTQFCDEVRIRGDIHRVLIAVDICGTVHGGSVEGGADAGPLIHFEPYQQAMIKFFLVGSPEKRHTIINVYA